MDNKTFWDRVRALDNFRELDNLSELGRILNVDKRTMWSLVNEERLPRLDKAVALAQHFGTTVEYLVTGKKEVKLKSSLTYLIDALNNATEEDLKYVERTLGIQKKQTGLPVDSEVVV